MKKGKNILLLIGATLGLFPLCIQGYKLIYYAFFYIRDLPRDILLSFLLSTVASGIIIVHALLLLILNLKNACGLVFPTIGIVINSIGLLSVILSASTFLPKYLIMSELNLAYFRYLINTLIISLNLPGMIGHVLLLIGSICSLPKKN